MINHSSYIFGGRVGLWDTYFVRVAVLVRTYYIPIASMTISALQTGKFTGNTTQQQYI